MKGIYCLLNTVNGKRYVGASVDVKNRWSAHRCSLRKGTHRNVHLQRAWNRDGEGAFVFQMLEEVADTNKLLNRERANIALYNSCGDKDGYNLSMPDETNTKFILPEETRRRMSEALKGKSPSEEHRRNLSKSRIGKRMPESSRLKMAASIQALYDSEYGVEYRRKQSEKHTGKVLTEEHIRNITKASTGRLHSEETRRKLCEINSNRSLETRRKLSEALKGKTLPEETRRKISESLKRYNAAKKASSVPLIAGIGGSTKNLRPPVAIFFVDYRNYIQHPASEAEPVTGC